MNDVQPWSGIGRGEDRLRQNLIWNKITRDQVQNRLIGRVHKVKYASGDHKDLEAARSDSVCPSHKGISIVALDDARPHDHDWQVASTFFDHALCKGLCEGIGVRVPTHDALFLLSDSLWPKFEDVLDDFIWVLISWQVVNFLFDVSWTKDVAVDIGGRDMRENLDLFTLQS